MLYAMSRYQDLVHVIDRLVKLSRRDLLTTMRHEPLILPRSHVPVLPVREEIWGKTEPVLHPHNLARCELFRVDGGHLFDPLEGFHTQSQAAAVQNKTSIVESADVDGYGKGEKTSHPTSAAKHQRTHLFCNVPNVFELSVE